MFRQALHEFGLEDPEFVAFFLPLVLNATPMIQTILEQTSATPFHSSCNMDMVNANFMFSSHRL